MPCRRSSSIHGLIQSLYPKCWWHSRLWQLKSSPEGGKQNRPIENHYTLVTCQSLGTSQTNSPSFNSWIILSLPIYIAHSCSCQFFTSSSFLSLPVSISLTLSPVQTALAPNCIDKYLPVLFECIVG